MPQSELPGIGQNPTLEQLTTAYMKLKRQLDWLLANLDHLNVKRLFTEHCTIQSEKGETVLNGPEIDMYDSDGTLRLKQGLDKATDAFVFELYDSDSKKTVYLDSGGNEVLDGKLQLTDSGNNLMIAFKDTKGGVVKLYDTGGLLNVKIGVESGAESNTGGTLILYLDSPYDTAPDADVYQRVGIGIRSDYKAGCFNLIDDNTKVRVSGTADSAIGPYIGVRNSAEELISYITETAGYVNGVKIATMNDISSWTVKTGTLTDPPSISVGQYYWDTVNNMPIFKGSDGWYDALGNLIG